MLKSKEEAKMLNLQQKPPRVTKESVTDVIHLDEFQKIISGLQNSISQNIQEEIKGSVTALSSSYASLSQQLKEVTSKVDIMASESKNFKRFFKGKLKSDDSNGKPVVQDIILYPNEKVTFILLLLYINDVYNFYQITYRGYDITDKINELMKDRSLNVSKLAIAIVRHIFGDRNMRFWQISKLPREIPADEITDEDQLKKPSKGRPRCLNNKDPEGVTLFKSKMN